MIQYKYSKGEKKMKKTIFSLTGLGVVTFWIGLTGAFQNDNITIGQFLIATMLLGVISFSIYQICK